MIQLQAQYQLNNDENNPTVCFVEMIFFPTKHTVFRNWRGETKTEKMIANGFQNAAEFKSLTDRNTCN